MRNLSLCKYRPGANGGHTVIALPSIFLWAALIGLGASQWPEPHRFYGIFTSILDTDEVEDIPVLYSGNCNDPETSARFMEDSLEHTGRPESIIRILTRHTRKENQEIRHQYSKIYAKDLLQTIVNKYNEQHANTYRLAFERTTTIPELLVARFREALFDDDYNAIAQVLTPIVVVDDDHITKELLRVLTDVFDDHVKKTVGQGDKVWQAVVHAQLKGLRSDNDSIDAEAACIQARTIADDFMSKSPVRKENVTTSRFHKILMETNYAQLRLVSKCYKSLHDLTTNFIKTTLPGVIVRHIPVSDRVQVAYASIAKYADNKSGYFANRLHKAIHGNPEDMGDDWIDTIDDKTVIFIVAWRADIDLGNIKVAYKVLYETTLYDDVVNHISGEHKDALLALIG